MRKFLKKIAGLFNISGRDLPVFLLSLLLAFSIWLIHNLSLKYNDFIQVPVIAHCRIEGHSDVSRDRSLVVARCRLRGFDIVRLKIFGKRSPVNVNFNRMRNSSGEIFYVTSDDLQEYTHVIFGENASLEYFVTDTLFFNFPFESHRRLPVVAVHELEFAPQYAMIGGIRIEPDSVTVYGEPERIENMDFVFTEPLKVSEVDSDLQGVLKLDKIRKVRFSEDAVRYSISAVRFVEVVRQVPVTVRNVPAGGEMTVYPSSVTATFKCRFPYGPEDATKVEFFVDYEDFVNSRTGRCVVRNSEMPSGIIDCSVEPQVAECIVSGL